MRSRVLSSLLPFVLSAGLAWADALPDKKRTLTGLYVTAAEAGEMLKEDTVLFVDIRSRAEVAFLGLPVRVDKHIPFMGMDEMTLYDDARGTYPMERNPDFARDFVFFMRDRAAGADTKVILMCRSGSRSAKAADLLARMGYVNVYTMVDGFEGDTSTGGRREVNGWKNAGLPWSYKVSAAQAYQGAY